MPISSLCEYLDHLLHLSPCLNKGMQSRRGGRQKQKGEKGWRVYLGVSAPCMHGDEPLTS